MKRKFADPQTAIMHGKPPAPGPITIVATPRQLALRKLYRFLLVGSGIALVIGVSAGGIIYADKIKEFFYPSARSRAALLDVEADDGSPLKLNAATPPGPAPDGMAWIPGGEFYMGTDDDNFPDAGPMHRVYVDGFWIDKTEVTNEQFAQFVKATKYLTVAEQEPDPAEFPGVPKDKLKPFSSVLKKIPPGTPVDLRDFHNWWEVCYGASWQHPEGPGSDIKGKEKYPVVHICFDDAAAYCKWANKRLPTEAEWEFAARGGLDKKKFTWGDEQKPGGKCMCNYWQGRFPTENTREDGYETAAPVGTYPANGYGLYDMAGNVWEWCSDFYLSDYFMRSPRKNPKGPTLSFDINEPESQKRVQRGGSFLCADNYCQRYIVGTRHHGEPKSASFHVGFRCAKDPR
jgi:formylglycine-generating enzyme